MAYNPDKGLVVLLTDQGNTALPLNFIQEKTYKYTPHSRTDLDSGVSNADGVLQRSVFTHTRSKIEFETRALWNDEWSEFMSILRSAWQRTNPSERKVYMEYWDSDVNGYDIGHFYVPDYTPQIDRIEGDRIKYAPCRFAFIEY